MFCCFCRPLIHVIVASIAMAAALSAADGDPLLIPAARLAEVRAAADRADTAQHAVVDLLRVWCAAQGEQILKGRDRSGTNWNYERSVLAQKAATLHLVAGDAASAQLALRAIRAMYEDVDPDKRLPTQGTALWRAATTLGLAYTWAMCREALSADDRAWLGQRVEEALAAWPSAKSGARGAPWHSNHNPVSFATELLLIAAAGDLTKRKARVDELVDLNLKHIATHGSSGWSQEGPVYLGYGHLFLVQAALALQAQGDARLADAYRARGFHKLAMYAGGFTRRLNATSWGVGAATFDNRGWLSGMLGLAGPDQAQYLWWYDRYCGTRSAAAPADRFDAGWGGQAIALLCYPTGVVATDPTGVWPTALRDSDGGAWLRDRWCDQDDTIVALYHDGSHYSPAWDGADAGVFSLITRGAVFASSSGGSDRSDLYSTISVDGATYSPKAGGVGGTLREVRSDARGGTILASLGRKIEALGASDERNLAVDWSGAATVLSIVDRITASKPHTYGWNQNPHDGVTGFSDGRESGRRFVRLATADGGWCKVWFLDPQPTEVQAADPVVATFASTAAMDCWVAMASGRGSEPVLRLSGDGAAAIAIVGDRRVTREAKTGVPTIAPVDGPQISFIAERWTVGPGVEAVLRAQLPAGATARWELGDGATATGAEVRHSYQRGGDYRVLLTADTPGGPIAAAGWIAVPNQPPIAHIATDRTRGAAPLAVAFDASSSSDPEQHALTFRWDFGDGTSAEGPRVAHTFSADAPRRRVLLKVTDAYGATAGAEVEILVGNQPPEAAFTLSAERGRPPFRLTVDASGSRDGDGDPLTYRWDFGKGVSASGVRAEHTFATSGDQIVRLTVEDGRGGSTTVERPVLVVNLPPVVQVTEPREPVPTTERRKRRESGPSGLDALPKAPADIVLDAAGSSDPEGSALTVRWTLPGGKTASGPRLETRLETPGQHAIVCTVTDADGASTSITRTIAVRDRDGALLAEGARETVPGLWYRSWLIDLPRKTGAGRKIESAGIYPWKPVNPLLADRSEVQAAQMPEALTLAGEGTIADISPSRLRARPWQYINVYDGYLRIPTDGEYRFTTHANTGIFLSLAGSPVLSNTAEQKLVTSSPMRLRAGLHALRLIHWYRDNGYYGNQKPYAVLAWEGPGIARQAVPRSALVRSPRRPQAAMTVMNAEAPPPALVRFDAHASHAGDGTPVASCQWDFGDGATGEGLAANHRYIAAGSYRVVLTVRTADGQQDSTTRMIHVLPRLDAMLPGLRVPGLNYRYYEFDQVTRGMPDWSTMEVRKSGVVPMPDVGIADKDDFFAIRFDGLLWVPVDGVYRFKLDSDDGANLWLDDQWVVDNEIITSTVQESDGLVNLAAGFHRLRIDYYENTVSQRIALSYGLPGGGSLRPVPATWYARETGPGANRAPTGSVQVDATTAMEGSATRMTVTGKDEDGDPLIARWDFGDGETGSGLEVSHCYTASGTYAARVRLADGRGGEVTLDSTVVIRASANRAPTVTVASEAVAGTMNGWRMRATAVDPDGDPVRVRWDFGDGTVGEGAEVVHGIEGGDTTVTATADDGRGAVGVARTVLSRPLLKSRAIGLGCRADPLTLLYPTEQMGIVPQRNWNVVVGGGIDAKELLVPRIELPPSTKERVQRTVEDLIDSTGARTSASVIGWWNGGRSASQERGGDASLTMRLCTSAVTFAKLPFARYDVYVAVIGSAPRPNKDKEPVAGPPLPVRLAIGDEQRYAAGCHTPFAGIWKESTATAADKLESDANVVVFRDRSGPGFTLEVESGNRPGTKDVAGWTFVQIVER